MKKSHALILLSVASLARLAPALWTGMPFSTDAWPLVSNVEKLLSETPIALSSNAFGGYNNFWPASQIFGAVLSRVTSLSAMDSMAFGIPVASSTAALVLYAISRRITGDSDVAFLSALIFSLAYPVVLFTAGVTKETFAIPLYLLLILLFLRRKEEHRTASLFFLTSLALVSAHHFATLMAVAILGLMAGSELIGGLRRRFSPSGLCPLLPVLLASMFGVYYFSFAWEANFSLPGLPQWISAGSYQLLGFSLVAYLTLSKSGRKGRKRKMLAGGASFLVLVFLLVGTRVPLISGAPTLPGHYIIYSIPFLLAAPLAALGGKGRFGPKNRAYVYAWLASVIAVLAYATFGGSTYGLTLGYRTINFLIPPLSILMASGTVLLLKSDAGLSSVAGLLALVAIILGGVFSYYGAVVREEKYMGYQALQTEGEFKASGWLSGKGGEAVAADMKSMYLLEGYRGIDVKIGKGYSYLIGGGPQPSALYVYEQMYRNGYVIGPYPRQLARDWPERVSKMDLLYTDGIAEIYGGSEK